MTSAEAAVQLRPGHVKLIFAKNIKMVKRFFNAPLSSIQASQMTVLNLGLQPGILPMDH